MNARQCTNCMSGMDEGYYCCDEYFCSRDCLDTSFVGTESSWDDHYSEDGDCFWTEWEPDEVAA